MAKRKTIIDNRGRFQAQGDGLEKSRPWTDVVIPTKDDGHNYLDDLKGQLKPTDLGKRQDCFSRASKWIDDAPSEGYYAVSPIKTSFLRYPPEKGIRVDGEIFRGKAFKNR